MHTQIQASFISETDNLAQDWLNVKKAYCKSLAIAQQSIKEKRRYQAKKLKALKEQARHAGYQCGIRQSLAVVEKEIREAKQVYISLISKANKDCLELALAVAQEILQDKICLNSRSIALKIKRQLANLSKQSAITILANPKQIEDLKPYFDENIKLTASNIIEEGNAVIENSCGEIELNWKADLERIKAKLLLSLMQHSDKEKQNAKALST